MGRLVYPELSAVKARIRGCERPLCGPHTYLAEIGAVDTYTVASQARTANAAPTATRTKLRTL